jgi:MarR family transcriptional regulator, temperature-dependent positive regulator of motility
MKFDAARAVLSSFSEFRGVLLTLKKFRGPNLTRRVTAFSDGLGKRNNELSTDVYDQPGHLIRRAHQIAVSMFYSTIGYHVTPVQYAVLRILQDHPGIDQVTLARYCALDTSTAADLAVRLEERGLVKRMVPMKSKRFRLLQLTENGTTLLKKLIPSGHLLNRRLLQPLNKEEQKIFLRLLRKFVHLNNEKSRAPLDRRFMNFSVRRAAMVESRRGSVRRPA